METLYRFNPAHADLVHDLAYDYYGQRLATCSSDQVLKVWDLAGTTQGGSQIDANGVGGDGVGGSPWVLNDAWRVG